MIVYKTTNLINGKIYIGQDSKNDPEYLGSGKYFKRAIKKYGKENFRKEIIEKCGSIEHLNKREIYWIDKLNSRDPEIGYNILKGGLGSLGYIHGEDFKNYIKNKNSGFGNFMYGKSLTQRWKELGYSEEEIKNKEKIRRKKQSNSIKGGNNPNFGNGKKIKGKKNPFYGKKHSPEFISKMKKIKSKPVLQFDKNGNPMREWRSLLEVKQELGIQCGPCCRGKNKTAGGFIWKFKNLK